MHFIKVLTVSFVNSVVKGCSMPGPMVSQAKQQLNVIIDAYLSVSDVETRA